MALTGLSLCGYLSDAEALQYFATACDVANVPASTLIQYWTAARAKLGDPIPRAGKPRLNPIGAEHNGYLDKVTKTQHFKMAVGDLAWAFHWVEIDPLLCFQLHISPDVAERKWMRTRKAPRQGAIIRQCLPTRTAPLHDLQFMQVIPGQPRFRIIAPDPSLAVLGARPRLVKGRNVLTFALDIGERCPLVQVVSFAGKYYLKNGFHRAHRLRELGVTHIPAVVIEAPTYEQAGLVPGFARHVLDSSNPPTCGHFSQGLAYPVQLKEAGGVIEIACVQGAFALGA